MSNLTATPRIIYAATLILAACSLLYELLIAQALATFAANTVTWYSVTVGLYLAGMGLGALLHERHPSTNLWARFFRVELALSAAGAIAVPLLHLCHTGGLLFDVNGLPLLGQILFFGAGLLLIISIGLLTGFELPILIDLANASSNKMRLTNRVLASDYAGSLLAGLAFPLMLVPNLSLITIGLIAASLNIALATLALRAFIPNHRQPGLRFVPSGLLALTITLGLYFSTPVDRYFSKLYYFYLGQSDDLGQLFFSMDNAEDVFRARSPYQKIDLVYNERGFGTDLINGFYSNKFSDNPQQPRNYALFLNGDFQLASNYEEHYHEFFAHIPIITNGAVPTNVLVMGGGDGLLLRELVKYPEIKNITHVDLDRTLVELAETHQVLSSMNEGALNDPRITRHFDDAYRFIRNATNSYDAIYLDFPAPKDYNLSKLYSREIYHFTRQRLASNGFMTLDAPGLQHSAEMREIYTSTLAAAGFNFVTPYISKIENVNEAALEFLRASGLSNEEARKLMASQAASMRLGFITARDSWLDRPIYRDPKIELHVLNDERLFLTLNKVQFVPPTNPERVNSIFRPVLQSMDIWDFREAW
ncbi:spermidine synthase [Luminiphilus sp. nBUS_07]|uniref:spermidine synthase n=1 Tax=Luminiphilus sp. nBUS_07 TaxID=3395314 RepID=UPI003EBAECF5